MQVVLNYGIKDQFDTLKNLRNGVYASRLITHNQLNKTYEETDFNYEINYPKSFHTETSRDGGKESEKGILSSAKNTIITIDSADPSAIVTELVSV